MNVKYSVDYRVRYEWFNATDIFDKIILIIIYDQTRCH